MRVARKALLVVLLATACHPGSQTIALGDDAGVVDLDGSTSDAGAADGGVDAGPAPVCSLQVFSFPDGYACNSDGDCESGHCGIPQPGEWPTGSGANPGICTRTCALQGTATECQAGYSCDYGYSITANSPVDLRTGLFCLPQEGTINLPGDASLPMGAPCWKPTDCAGAGSICGANDYGAYMATFCAPTCDDTHASCGDCGACTQPFAQAQKFCTFTGAKAVGEPCSHNDECETNACNTFCTVGCSATVPCPAGSTCEMFTYEGQPAALCVDPAQPGRTADGAACRFDFECATGSRCVLNDQYVYVCAHPASLGEACDSADSCATGLDCRQLSSTVTECSTDCGTGCAANQTCYAPDINTYLQLLSSDGVELTYNDNAPGTTSGWSRISSWSIAPGSYGVSVRVYYGLYRGKYKLKITDSLGTTPTVWRELPETPTTNDTWATAQGIPFPVELSAELSSASDVDYFSFIVPINAIISLETLPGAPSACLPSAQVASSGLGEPCSAPLNCRDGLTCDATLHACTSSCTVDGDCVASGATCQTVSGRRVCASAAQLGHVANGQTCAADWQCMTGARCVASGTGRLCAVACDAGTDPDAGSAESCATGFECGSAVTLDSTVMRSCLPRGSGQAAFGAACVLDSDCNDGMTCTSGRCGATCATTADCPYHPTFSDNPIVCRPCSDTAQCTTMTEEGACVMVGGDRYCAMPCGYFGECPDGFSCVATSPVDSYSSVDVCEPVDRSCRAPTCSTPAATDGGTTEGRCAIPVASLGEMCTSDSQCSTGRCASGFCSQPCHTNADCGCPAGDLFCAGSLCRPAAYTNEVEPNDTFTSAQALTLPAKVMASFQSSGAESDEYVVQLTAGHTLNITTRPVCGVGATGTSLSIYVYDSTYATVASYAPFSLRGYGKLLNVPITMDGAYYIQVIDQTSPRRGRESAYVLEVTTSP